MKEVYGKQSLARCTKFRWCQRYEAGSVNMKVLATPWAGARCDQQCHDFAVDDLIWQNRLITTHEIAVKLSISKGINCASHNPQKA
ncbi:hypothetical protein AVEN_127253-1 [Araneus ventricosus]|uniref:Mos1 transposase HTH domain-containing protein n=1 Tax=Araneus ventricosus TaxID=182803 RepID=A0A4Y2VLB9_ARAVE|nr:hypothetical protein AVEN_127253-1 [Araneus ventricosus]